MFFVLGDVVFDDRDESARGGGIERPLEAAAKAVKFGCFGRFGSVHSFLSLAAAGGGEAARELPHGSSEVIGESSKPGF